MSVAGVLRIILTIGLVSSRNVEGALRLLDLCQSPCDKVFDNVALKIDIMRLLTLWWDFLAVLGEFGLRTNFARGSDLFSPQRFGSLMGFRRLLWLFRGWQGDPLSPFIGIEDFLAVFISDGPGALSDFLPENSSSRFPPLCGQRAHVLREDLSNLAVFLMPALLRLFSRIHSFFVSLSGLGNLNHCIIFASSIGCSEAALSYHFEERFGSSGFTWGSFRVDNWWGCPLLSYSENFGRFIDQDTLDERVWPIHTEPFDPRYLSSPFYGAPQRSAREECERALRAGDLDPREFRGCGLCASRLSVIPVVWSPLWGWLKVNTVFRWLSGGWFAVVPSLVGASLKAIPIHRTRVMPLSEL
ncbi:hypothetical protein FNV43_RR03540 [Rhamnella rubrinervis]|uniref:Uncharacterized protein n=1 Tax=Rhamnella rubrinervis TaxID=2594499 RepID=A0A8K0HHW8_9ROSA|nr:hypothetical protein FNV43_RR03540 [Rhamnella rubrinervis]